MAFPNEPKITKEEMKEIALAILNTQLSNEACADAIIELAFKYLIVD